MSLSLSDQELKLALITRGVGLQKDVARLLSFSVKDLPEEEVMGKLKTLFEDLKLKSPRLLVSISSRWAITRTLEIPSLNASEIREIVNLQASRHTPYSRTEIIADYIDLGIFKRIYTKIFLTIIPRASLKRYDFLFEKLGLQVEKMSFALEAMARSFSKWLRFESTALPWCLIHIDIDTSDFAIISKTFLIFIRSIPIGAQHLSSDPGYRNTFLEEVKKSLEVYQSENIDQNPSQAVLAGGLKSIDDWQTKIQELLRVPVRTVKDAAGFPVQIDSRPDYFNQDASYWDIVAPPLVSKDLVIDLVPEEIKLQRALAERSREIVRMGILAVVFFGLICALFLSQLSFRAAIVNQMKRRYEPIQKEAKGIEAAYAQIQAVKSYLTNRGRSLESLAEVYKLIPGDLFLTNIKWDGDKLSLKGSSLSRASIFTFVGALEDSAVFQHVQTKHVTERREEDQKYSDFDIVAVIEKGSARGA